MILDFVSLCGPREEEAEVESGCGHLQGRSHTGPKDRASLWKRTKDAG